MLTTSKFWGEKKIWRHFIGYPQGEKYTKQLNTQTLSTNITESQEFHREIVSFDPSAALMLSNSYFPPRHVWLWLIEAEEASLGLCARV